MKIWICCSECGSRDVTRDAIARWDDEAQDWEACAVLDNTDCETCGEERSLDEVEIVPDNEVEFYILDSFGWTLHERDDHLFHLTHGDEITDTFIDRADAYCWARANDRT